MSREIDQLKQVFDNEAQQLEKLQKILAGLNEVVSTHISHADVASSLLDLLGTEKITLQHIRAWWLMLDQMLMTWAICVRLEAAERAPLPKLPGSN